MVSAVPRAYAAVLLALLAASPLASAGLVGEARHLAGATADDWHVGGRLTLQGATLTLFGDLVVLPGARLTLEDSTLVFAATTEHHPALRVLPGAVVEARNLTLTNDARGTPEARAARWFDVDVQGTLALRDSVVEFARLLSFHGAAATGVVESSTVRYSVVGGFQFTRGATGVVRANHVHSNMDADHSATGRGVYVIDTTGVLVESNLFERLVGPAVVAVQSSVAGATLWETSATVRGNLIVDDAPARDPFACTFGVYADGAAPETLVENNVVVSSCAGIGTAFGAGGLVRGNDVLSLTGAPEGLRANGTLLGGREARWPTFESNRVRGFALAAHAAGGGNPVFRGNDLGESNGLGLLADATPVAIDARGNWWGAGGADGRTTGPVDASAALDAPPLRLFDLDARYDAPDLLVLRFTNRGPEALHVEVFHRGVAFGQPVRFDVPPGAFEWGLATRGAPPAGEASLLLARSEEGLAAVAVATFP